MIAFLLFVAAGCAETEDEGPSVPEPYEALEGKWTLVGVLDVAGQSLSVPGEMVFSWNSTLPTDQTAVVLTQTSDFNEFCGVKYLGTIELDAVSGVWSGTLETDLTNQPPAIEGLLVDMTLEPRANLSDEYRFKILFDASQTGDSIHQLCESGPADGINGTIIRVQ